MCVCVYVCVCVCLCVCVCVKERERERKREREVVREGWGREKTVCVVMVIVVGNRHGDLCSNPRID